MQLMNIQYGGTLHQDISEHEGALATTSKKGPNKNPLRTYSNEADSLLAKLCGPEALPCNHTHHQTMKDLGFGLQVAGKTSDGVIEAIEDPEREFVLGVQWHPELLNDARQDKDLQVSLRLLVTYFCSSRLRLSNLTKSLKNFKLYGSCGTITLLADDNFSNAFIWAILIVVLVTINENNQVGILLDCARLT